MATKSLEEFYAQRIDKGLWTVGRYLETFKAQLEEQQLLADFEHLTRHAPVYMLRYDIECMEGTLEPFDYVAGGAWPGGFSVASIRDCSDYALSMQEQVLRRTLKVRCGEYAIPRRLHAGLSFPLTDEQMPEVLAQMTPKEHAAWRTSASRVDVRDYPTREAPVCVRLTGIDDGVEAGFFRTVQEAEEVLRDLARHVNSLDRRKMWGFIFTD